MRRIISGMLLGSLLVVGSGSMAFAADGSTEPVTTTAQASAVAPTPTSSAQQIQRLAKITQLDAAIVTAKLQAGVKPIDLVMGARLATLSKKPLDDVLALFTQGKTWNDVRQTLGLKIKEVGKTNGFRHQNSVAQHGRVKNVQHRTALKRNQNGAGALQVARNLGLADDQIKQLQDLKFKAKDIVASAYLAKQSGKPVLDIAKMKTPEITWIGVAKSLGIDSSTFQNALKAARQNHVKADQPIDGSTQTPPAQNPAS